jgi:hypothetical protein
MESAMIVKNLVAKFFLLLVYETCVWHVADAAKAVKFEHSPVVELFAFPMRAETLEIVVDTDSINEVSADDDLEVCVITGPDAAPEKVALRRGRSSSFRPAVPAIETVLVARVADETAKLKRCLRAAIDETRMAVIRRVSDESLEPQSMIRCRPLYSLPRSFTKGLRDVLGARVAVENAVPDGYPEAGAFVSYLIHHSRMNDLPHFIGLVFAEQDTGGYGHGGYNKSIASLFDHAVNDWHFGLIRAGRMNSRVSKWPAFFIHEVAEVATVASIVDEALSSDITVSSPMRGSRGLVQIGFPTLVQGVCFVAPSIPKTRAAFTEPTAMISSNRMVVDIVSGSDIEGKYEKQACDEVSSAGPVVVNFASLRVTVGPDSRRGSEFTIQFSSLFPLPEDKFSNASSEFDAKLASLRVIPQILS